MLHTATLHCRGLYFWVHEVNLCMCVTCTMCTFMETERGVMMPIFVPLLCPLFASFLLPCPPILSSFLLPLPLIFLLNIYFLYIMLLSSPPFLLHLFKSQLFFLEPLTEAAYLSYRVNFSVVSMSCE